MSEDLRGRVWCTTVSIMLFWLACHILEWDLTQITQVLEWPTSQPAKNGPTSSFISFPLLHARMALIPLYFVFLSISPCCFFFFLKSICHDPNSGRSKIWPVTPGQRFDPKGSSYSMLAVNQNTLDFFFFFFLLTAQPTSHGFLKKTTSPLAPSPTQKLSPIHYYCYYFFYFLFFSFLYSNCFIWFPIHFSFIFFHFNTQFYLLTPNKN